MLNEISRLGSSLTEQITFNFTSSQDIELHSAFRMQPDASPLTLGSPLSFGFMPRQGAINIMLEFLVKDIPENSNNLSLAKGFINYQIPRHPVKTRYVQRLEFNRRITKFPITEPIPHAIINAITLVSLYRMQDRAREEMGKGDLKSATRHLEILATHLLKKGEEELAQSVMNEVSYIQHNQSFSEDGEKRLKYGTRSLLLPARTVEG
jgi:Ca-activated chloride channel family protein